MTPTSRWLESTHPVGVPKSKPSSGAWGRSRACAPEATLARDLNDREGFRASVACAPSDAKEVWPLSGALTDDELAALVHRITKAAEALIRGDIEGYAARIKHADDYTLMSPYGGDPVRGFDDSDEAVDALARFFRGGEANVEVVETYASGDLAVVVVIERQHGTIGDLPEQDWSLRVTWVFRRTAESDWEVVHRHADALVHAIDHERLGALARGQ
jgi:ketosteroid isomerase-like protein